MPILGLDAPRAEVDAIFDEMDLDNSGVLAYKELQTKLRPSADLPPAAARSNRRGITATRRP